MFSDSCCDLALGGGGGVTMGEWKAVNGVGVPAFVVSVITVLVAQPGLSWESIGAQYGTVHKPHMHTLVCTY